MRSRKLIAAGICGVVGLGLVQSVAAASTTNNDVPVSYNYTGAAEPVDPGYSVVIPTGLVFDARNPDYTLEIDVTLEPAQGQTEINGQCKASVKVKSANGYIVKLEDGSDAIPYIMKYGDGPAFTGTDAINIGTLAKNASSTPDCDRIAGIVKLDGIATRTGNHADKLTYTITNELATPGA